MVTGCSIEIKCSKSVCQLDFRNQILWFSSRVRELITNRHFLHQLIFRVLTIFSSAAFFSATVIHKGILNVKNER
jgi:hypothetical protein